MDNNHINLGNKINNSIGKGNIVLSNKSINPITNKNIIEKQEKTRSHLAMGFSIGYGMLIFFFVYITVAFELSTNNANLLTVLLSSSTGFVGTILGFYFGQNGK